VKLRLLVLHWDLIASWISSTSNILLSVCLPVCLFLCVCLYVSLSVCLSVCLFVCLSVHLQWRCQNNFPAVKCGYLKCDFDNIEWVKNWVDFRPVLCVSILLGHHVSSRSNFESLDLALLDKSLALAVSTLSLLDCYWPSCALSCRISDCSDSCWLSSNYNPWQQHHLRLLLTINQIWLLALGFGFKGRVLGLEGQVLGPGLGVKSFALRVKSFAWS